MEENNGYAPTAIFPRVESRDDARVGCRKEYGACGREYQLSPKRLEVWKGEWRAKGELAFPGQGGRPQAKSDAERMALLERKIGADARSRSALGTVGKRAEWQHIPDSAGSLYSVKAVHDALVSNCGAARDAAHKALALDHSIATVPDAALALALCGDTGAALKEAEQAAAEADEHPIHRHRNSGNSLLQILCETKRGREIHRHSHSSCDI
jgi:hypothetical protein